MSKQTVFTTIAALPAGITRETVIEALHNHLEMIEYVVPSPIRTTMHSITLIPTPAHS